MYYHSELRTLVYRDLAQPSANNDRLATTDVTIALNMGYKDLAERTRCFRRSVNIPMTTGTATYLLPPDMAEIIAVSYGTTASPLRKTSIEALTYEDHDWRATAAGTPERWYMDDARKVGVYVGPSFTGSKNLVVEGYVVPHKIGGGITALSRASNVTTATCAAPHFLSTGDVVDITECVDTVFNGTSLAVVSVPLATTFTYGNTGSDDTDTTANVFFSTGVPFLSAATDIPKVLAAHHILLVHFAVWTLGAEFFASDPEAQVRVSAAKEAYQAGGAALALEVH